MCSLSPQRRPARLWQCSGCVRGCGSRPRVCRRRRGGQGLGKEGGKKGGAQGGSPRLALALVAPLGYQHSAIRCNRCESRPGAATHGCARGSCGCAAGQRRRKGARARKDVAALVFQEAVRSPCFLPLPPLSSLCFPPAEATGAGAGGCASFILRARPPRHGKGGKRGGGQPSRFRLPPRTKEDGSLSLPARGCRCPCARFVRAHSTGRTQREESAASGRASGRRRSAVAITIASSVIAALQGRRPRLA